MNVKTKLFFGALGLSISNSRARTKARKIKKNKVVDRFPDQELNDWVLKKAKKILKIFGVTVKVEGYDNLPKKSALLIPNHTSSFDPAIILASLETQDPSKKKPSKMPMFLAKEEAKKHKRTIGYQTIINTHYLSRINPRKSLKQIDEFFKEAKEKNKYAVVFAEGTRSKNGEVQQFKSGALRGASKFFLPIIPVTINNAIDARETSREKREVTVIFHKPMKPMMAIGANKKQLAEKIRKIVESKWVAPQGKITIKDKNEV
ncbi:MAG: 1-acyl-sn-glycerol-3-phosphate acyltransferase [Mollicutes bacterium PWAP]|nr:1-acyl-sn-glycerol-3-phosphate acyltransferase [Mollicutes bacterium PWAP]